MIGDRTFTPGHALVDQCVQYTRCTVAAFNSHRGGATAIEAHRCVGTEREHKVRKLREVHAFTEFASIYHLQDQRPLILIQTDSYASVELLSLQTSNSHPDKNSHRGQ